MSIPTFLAMVDGWRKAQGDKTEEPTEKDYQGYFAAAAYFEIAWNA